MTSVLGQDKNLVKSLRYDSQFYKTGAGVEWSWVSENNIIQLFLHLSSLNGKLQLYLTHMDRKIWLVIEFPSRFLANVKLQKTLNNCYSGEHSSVTQEYEIASFFLTHGKDEAVEYFNKIEKMDWSGYTCYTSWDRFLIGYIFGTAILKYKESSQDSQAWKMPAAS